MEESGKAQVLRESFVYLNKAYGKALFSFKIFKGMSWPDDMVSSNVELTSSTVASSSFTVAISWGPFSYETILVGDRGE